MQLSVQFTPLAAVEADWLVAGVWENEPWTPALAALDAALAGVLSRLREADDIRGKAGELVPLRHCPGIAPRRLLLVGLGERAQADRFRLLDAMAAAARLITDRNVPVLAAALPEGTPGLDAEETARIVLAGLSQGCYGPGIRKTEPARWAPGELRLVAPPGTPQGEVLHGANRGWVEAQAVRFAQELVNLPPAELYPETFAQKAQEACAGLEIDCLVLDERQIEAERMGALLGVARGSDRPPRLVVLRYRRGNGPTLGLVGKGVTFDSGGLSLKTTEQMVDMKCDMAGAATVLAAFTAIAALRLPVNLLGVLALVENLPSGKALKLGDVLTARNGKTIEVLNTDAEGRLILADALAYAVDHKADHLVDLATLTGSCLIALGTQVAGLMSNRPAWQERLLRAAERAGERAWPLPMFSIYDDLLKSHVADLKNTPGTRYGGAIAGGKFLEQFVGSLPWAHLDIAGPAWAERESPSRDPGGTGCFIRTLVELARDYSASP
jgi:leucyl aminopeptidase